MKTTLTSLPSELVAAILVHLSIPSLLAFSATSRFNQILAQRMLQDLNLAIFPRDIYCQLALMLEHRGLASTYESQDAPHFSVSKITGLPFGAAGRGQNPAMLHKQQIAAQNKIAADILSKKSVQNLKSLSLYMYEICSSELTAAIASNLPKLRELELKFCHEYVHDQTLPANYWREAPDGSPCWNTLVGLGADNQRALRLRGLCSLAIERAGLTSTQLRTFIQSNPPLRQLHLNNVTGVDQDFVDWLAAYCNSGYSRLERIEFESCPRLKMQRPEDFAWLIGITGSGVTYLSLWNCRNVRHEMLVDLIENGGDKGFELDTFETIIPPKGPVRHYGIVEEAPSWPSSVIVQSLAEMNKIDVDPEYIDTASRSSSMR